MAYRIRYRKTAKEELTIAQEYSSEFSEQLARWISDLADGCHSPPEKTTVDYAAILEHLAQAGMESAKWKYALKKSLAVSTLEKIRALIHLVRRRGPPYELRSSLRWFHGVLGIFNVEAQVIYEVDHVNKQMIIVAFTGLPQQDC